MNKKAIQLSINFVVIIILSITVFISGLYYLNKIFKGAEKTTDAYYQQFDKQMQDVMCSSLERVCIPKDRAVIGKTNGAVFGVGILNVLGSAKDFTISVGFDKGYQNDGTVINSCSGCDIQHVQGDFTIKNNEQENRAILINIPGGQSGTYIFNVNIKYDGSTPYDSVHKLYVEVP